MTWIALGVVGLVVLARVALYVLTAIAKRTMHVRTRDDPPQPGDVWVQDESLLRITRITEDQRIVIEAGMESSPGKIVWSDSPERWRERVYERKLWRTKP